MTRPLAFGPCPEAPYAPPGRAFAYAKFGVSIEHRGGNNENSISASSGFGDGLRLHQQRQPESTCENDRGRPGGLDDDRDLPRRHPAAVPVSQ
jgi:hypothetical protein